MSRPAIDLTGQRFGAWTVINAAGIGSSGRLTWNCRCICGVERAVRGQRLRAGRSKSCGCTGVARTTQANTKHGMARKAERNVMYSRWQNMVGRCHCETNDAFRFYGARGIQVCDRWRFGEAGATGVECFLADVGLPPFEGATIDREDNSGNYEPSNVRWATPLQQSRNSRWPKLNVAMAAEIKAEILTGELNCNLAEKYGVARSSISGIRNGHNWGDVNPSERGANP